MTATCEECGLSIVECNARALDRIEQKRTESIERQRKRIAELEVALRHAVEIAEGTRIGGTWDDLLPYRKLLSST